MGYLTVMLLSAAAPPDIAALISSTGFPIAMCVYMMYYIPRMMNKFCASLEQNTLELTKLLEYIKTVIEFERGRQDNVA